MEKGWSAAQGNKDAELKVISLGMGVQSTAVYLMSSMGYKLPRADYAVFADPQAEHYKTYELLEWLKDWQKKNDGIEIIVNKDHNIKKDVFAGENKSGGKWATIPAFGESGGMVMRQCTNDYKIQPVRNSVRKLYKLKKRQRMKPTEMWLGISTDEIQRMKWSRMYNIEYFYPLIYHNISRNDCVKFFKDNNFPVPVKSSCVFCPFHSDKFWLDIKKENGDAWKDSVRADRAIRDSSARGVKDKLYLHRSLKPLEEVDLNEDQLDLFEEECEGYCGL